MRRLRVRGRLVFPDTNEIVFNEASVHVEPKAMEVLLKLVDYPGEVVSRTEFLESVWGGRFICEDVVTNAISSLRRALSDNCRDRPLIQTVPKRGYRLMFRPTRETTEEPAGDTPAATPAVSPESMIVADESIWNWSKTDLNPFILRVRHLRHEETEASLKTACAYCEEIIRHEPNCAAAYAELSLSLFLLEKHGSARREEIEPKVRSAVDRALSLDERAAMSLVCLAKQEYRYDWKWHEAEHHFRQALEADSLNADVFAEFSILLSTMRRFDESLRCIHSACVLDRMSPAVRLQAGHTNYASGNWDAAVLCYQQLLRCTPQHVFARWGLADALTRAGRPSEAIATLSEGLLLAAPDPNPLLVTTLARTKATIKGVNRRSTAYEQLQQETSDPVLLAELYGSVGELKRAFALLDQAIEVKHYRLSAVNMFPQFEQVRADERYHQPLKRVGLYG
jgi:DNA-binding winged helix-turn-helix (wHTH) protein/Tfp pilus assembly protein PilF